MEKLTLTQLKTLPENTIFAQGTVTNHPDDVFMKSSRIGDKMVWVAKRGIIHDWAIYIFWAERGAGYAADHGDKINRESIIRRLVPCTDEAFEMYRI